MMIIRTAKILVFIILMTELCISCQGITDKNTNHEVHGLDVSRYQGEVDWNKAIQDTIHFVFVKATEGGDYVDPKYDENRAALKNYNIIKGAYHYFLPKTPADLQIDNFYIHAKLELGDLPPVVDFENAQNLPAQIVINSLSQMLDGLEEKYHVKPIIYTSMKIYYSFIAGRFDQYPIWIARYSDKEPKLSESKDWTFWQYGQRGKMPGIRGYVDFNVFSGNMTDLRALCLPTDPYKTREAL